MDNRHDKETEIKKLRLTLNVLKEFHNDASQSNHNKSPLNSENEKLNEFFPNGVTKELQEAIKNLNDEIKDPNLIVKLLEKFYRRTDKAYAKERFDLASLDELLKSEDALNYFISPPQPQPEHKGDDSFRQKINIVTKVIDHLELVGLMGELLEKYPKDVYAIERTAYMKQSEQEQQGAENTRYNKFYTDLTVVNALPADPDERKKHAGIDPETGVKTIKRYVIKPNEHLRPRLSYAKFTTKTPQEKKHGITTGQTLKNIGLKAVTTLGITILGAANANKVPGQGFLGPIRRLDNIQELKDTKIKKIISIEETLVSERRRLFRKKKASAHTYDITSAGISVIKVESPDLTPMSKQHTEMVARAIFETVKKLGDDENFLIHCKAGMSRSATSLLAFYVMYATEMKEKAKNDADRSFFEDIEKLITGNPPGNVDDLVQRFRNNPDTRRVKLLEGQKQVLNNIIQEQRWYRLRKAASEGQETPHPSEGERTTNIRIDADILRQTTNDFMKKQRGGAFRLFYHGEGCPGCVKAAKAAKSFAETLTFKR